MNTGFSSLWRKRRFPTALKDISHAQASFLSVSCSWISLCGCQTVRPPCHVLLRRSKAPWRRTTYCLSCRMPTPPVASWWRCPCCRSPELTLWGFTHFFLLLCYSSALFAVRLASNLSFSVRLPLQVPLCHYREAVFKQDAHRRLVEEVQAQLKAISDDITERNSQLELPYPYLCPARIENSVAI